MKNDGSTTMSMDFDVSQPQTLALGGKNALEKYILEHRKIYDYFLLTGKINKMRDDNLIFSLDFEEW